MHDLIDKLTEAGTHCAEANRNSLGVTVDVLVVPEGIKVQANRLVGVERRKHAQVIHWPELVSARINPVINMIDGTYLSLV